MIMEALYNLANKATRIDQNRILNAILANPHLQQEILDLNRYGQLFNKGIDSTGKRLSEVGGPYSPVTMEVSRRKGRPKKSPQDINLFDEGDFYRSFYITLGEKEFYIEADPMKPGGVNLLEEWGADVLGLTEESRQELISWIKDEMVPVVVEYLLAA